MLTFIRPFEFPGGKEAKNLFSYPREMNIIKAVKKKGFLFLIASLALSGTGVFSAVSSFEKAKEVQAATSYIDVSNGLSSLTSGSFYLFGAYAEENGTPYMYLMAFPGYGSFARVPCLSKSDAAHPCGIAESDFGASCLNSIILATTYSGSDLCFAFTTHVSALYADPNSSYSWTGTTSENVTPSVSFDTSASPETMTLGSWEYQITNQEATFKGYASNVESGYSTALYVYPVATSLLNSVTAVGFAAGLSAGLYTSSNAQSVYQGLNYTQRNLFAYYMNTYRTNSIATQAVEKILINGVTVYQNLMSEATTGIFLSKAPTYSVDYVNDEITGLLDDESYTLAINGTDVCRVSTSGGSFPLSGVMDNASYDCTGSTISLNVYWPSGDGGGNTSSDAVSATVSARVAAPAVGVSALSLPISDLASENVNGIYGSRLSFAPEDGVQYLCLPTDTSFNLYDASNYHWLDTPDFTTVGNSIGTALSPETSYTIYKRSHSTTAPDSLPKYDEANSAYLGTSFTTLNELDSAKKQILISNYQFYQTQLAKLGDGADGANLAKMLANLRKKVESATALSDLGALLSGNYSSSAFSFAEMQDSAVASIQASVALTASDSSATEALLKSIYAQISALDFFASATVDQIAALQAEALWKSEAFRYRENRGKSLVDFFNASILSSTGNLSDAKVDELWSLFNSSFQSLITSLASDLTSSKAAADAAYSSATSALSAKLQELLG